MLRIFPIGVAAAMLMLLAVAPASADKARPKGAHVGISLGDGTTLENKKPDTKQMKARPKTAKCAGGFDCSELTQWSTGSAKKGPGSRAKKKP